MNPRHAIASRIAVSVVALALALTGCSATGDRLADDYRNGTESGYISGDGSLVTVGADQRGTPVEFEATLDTGDAVSTDDFAGEVVVVNFWYASCPPCRDEADLLEQLHDQYGERVRFLGVNVSDTATIALAFENEFGVGYPSVIDYEDNAVQLAFASSPLPPISTPSTIVLDRDGRIAARISGALQGTSPLDTIIDDLLAEAA